MTAPEPQTTPGTAGTDSDEERRATFSGPPPGATGLSGWALLPLRAFLGVTFCFAGLQKLANPAFFDANSPASIQAQLIASNRLSPLHPLLEHLTRFAVPIGVSIALAELAVGIGALLGLWTRVAAVGGALLALMLFLTVSFHSSPYYTGADIVFFFAWLPLILAGSGGVLSVDALIAGRVGREAGRAPVTPVPVRFASIQAVCGHYEQDRCRAKGGDPCDVRGCPFLAELAPVVQPRRHGGFERRAVVLGGIAAAFTAVGALLVAAMVAGFGRALSPATSGGSGAVSLVPNPASETAPASGAAGTAVGPAREVPVGGSARFTDPTSGDPALVLRPETSTFVAFDAVCPHAGCTVAYQRAVDLIVCPCHGSQFNPETGAVEVGPAPHGLARIPISEGTNGQLYVTD
jgi:thiosulfate dehydrogenase [quinone] large subunit